MKKDLIILDEDKDWAKTRIAQLEKEIQALGPAFYDVFNQSSETWHDNAPFDALRDHQSMLDAELQSLRAVLRSSLPSVPKQKRSVVGIGSAVTLKDAKGVHRRYIIAGDWTYRAGQTTDDATVISREAPLARELVGKKIGAISRFGEIIGIET
jgi:transcription elongation GreA/GreB family factor